MKEEAIPLIDAAALRPGRPIPLELVDAVDSACRGMGFFTVVNHAVDTALISNVFAQLKSLFDLPSAEKQKIEIHKSPFMRGYFSEGADKSDGVLGDIKEGFDMATDLPVTDPYVRAKLPFYGPNAWPAALPDFRHVMTDYHKQTLAFGKDLLRVFALALDVPASYFDEKFTKPMAQLRLLRYPSIKYRPGMPIGAGEHTDFGWITMILQDNAGGLEVQSTSGAWIKAAPIDNAFVVNVGDLMQRWTNDRYKATLHRVINTSGRVRHSAAFFMDPDYTAKVECLHSCQSVRAPSKYPPILAGEYMDKRFLETTTFRETEAV
ncbi:2-oxoglutarate and iron-dependent oxygenase domain-containing protein [uncultured Pseudomonas sp.]|uniref:isopenicillin N synthase family dioxygenase n=1 Tax=uncultured Pseudomonas sp. TaxID=114707 RepID=UPI0025F9B3EA|nr:2-oxoglutarate and iron-dependent oxygenase domain-containing protein [uncultured Pseudomonas sp.]